MIITNFDRWDGNKFGNKLLGVNNLLQISHFYNQDYDFNHFNGLELFDINTETKKYNGEPYETLNLTDLFNKKNEDIVLDNNIIYYLEPCLGDLFFKFDSIKTNEIFKFNLALIPPIKDKVTIAIHFRGKDFHVWNPKSILSLDYYIEAINEFENVKFKLFTDDLSMFTYNEVKKYLTEKGLEYELGDINDLVKDFISMSYCDGIISAPSTFSIAAGFCGKKNKKIIHSKNWVDYQCGKNDKFWVGFNNGGNQNYKKYKLI